MRTPGISGSLAFTEGVTTGPFFGQFAPVVGNNQGSGNITGQVADILQGGADTILFLSGPQSGGVNYTLASLASLFASLSGFGPQDMVGASWKLRVVNAATTQIITVVAGTGWALGSGTYTLANNSFRDFVVGIISPTSASLVEIGSGTYP